MRAVGLDPAATRTRDRQRAPVAPERRLRRLTSTPSCSGKGFLRRDVQRLINQDRNSFAASMVALGHADGMVTGVTRSFDVALEEVQRVIDPTPGGRVMGLSRDPGQGPHPVRGRHHASPKCPTATSWWRSPSRRPTRCGGSGYDAARGLPQLLHLRQPARRARRKGARGGGHDGRAAASGADIDFEYEGDMPPELALEPDAPERLSVLAPDRRRPTC